MSISYLGTIVVVSFYPEIFYANLFCHETFSVGSAALMIVTWLAREVIYFPSNLAICYAHLLTFVVRKSGFDFVPGTQVAISASDGSFLLWESHLCLPPASGENLSFLLPAGGSLARSLTCQGLLRLV